MYIFVEHMMLVVKNCTLLLLVAVLLACSSPSDEKTIPINDFFKSQDRATYRLSPDGKSISYLKLQGKKQNLFVEDLASGSVVQLTKLKEKNIGFYTWVSNNELVYYRERQGQRVQSDFLIINKDGLEEKQLSADDKNRIRILNDQLIDDKFLLVLSNKRDSTVADVYRLNVRDGDMRMVLRNPGNFTNWLTDGKGQLRMAMSSDGVSEAFWYRESDSQKFKQVMVNNFKTTFMPVAIAENKSHTVYAVSNVNRDKNALVELDCNTGEEKKILFYNDSLNVVDAQYSRRRDEMAYVVYETWKKQKFYLDTDSKALYQNIDKLLPKTESRIIDQDKNENVFVIRTFTDRNPGSYYLYTASTNQIKKLSDINPSINQEEMCEMKPISFTSRDGLKINGYLTLPKTKKAGNLPVIVFPHNGPGQRNTWGYNADVQFMASRGYAVLQINYRGSSGYGKAYYSAGFGQWGAKIQDDINDGVNWLVKEGVADSQKIAIYGYGFGGYIAIVSAIKNPNLYKCAASNMGVLNLFSYLKSIPPFLKTNLQMYYDIIGNPDKDADYMRQASPVFHADKIKIPILITQNIKDPRINANDAIQFVKELKKLNVPVTYLEQTDGSSPTDRDENRQMVYSSLEQFLQTNLIKK